MSLGRDPDDLHGDEVVAYLRIAVRRNGAMSVEGCINQEAYALAMCDSAKDSIRNHNLRNKIAGGGLIVPGNLHDARVPQ